MNLSKKLARGGIFTGLGIVMLYMTAMVPSGKLVMYFLTALPVSFIIVEAGLWTGVMVYAAISLLSFLLLGNILVVLPFLLFFGHYGIFKFLIEKGRKRTVEIAMKLAVFNVSGIIAYLLYTKLIGISVIALPLTPLYVSMMILAAQFLFFIYDYTYTMMIDYYRERIQPKL